MARSTVNFCPLYRFLLYRWSRFSLLLVSWSELFSCVSIVFYSLLQCLTSCSPCHMSLFLIVRRLALFLNFVRLPRSCAFFISGSKVIYSLSSRARKRGGDMNGLGGGHGVVITLISHLSSVICDSFNFSIFLASALSSPLG